MHINFHIIKKLNQYVILIIGADFIDDNWKPPNKKPINNHLLHRIIKMGCAVR